MKPQGGTELLFKNLIKHVGLDWQRNVNLIISVCDPNRINSQINVLWQHLMTDQHNTFGMDDPQFRDAIQHYIYVSNWQLKQYEDKYQVQSLTNHVIKNAIEPIDFINKPTDKIRLIYTSMPNRGLEVLLDAFEIMNRDDVELCVYSSNIIYGKGYNSSINTDYLFHRCKIMKNVKYYGYALNNAVRKAVQSSHILAYPSIFEETSCLAAIEAGSAGCRIVTTNYGALPETCSEWATFVDFTHDRKELTNQYAEVLNNEINNYSISDNYKEQSEWFNNTYSWHNRKHEWDSFFKSIT